MYLFTKYLGGNCIIYSTFIMDVLLSLSINRCENGRIRDKREVSYGDTGGGSYSQEGGRDCKSTQFVVQLKLCKIE